MKGDIAWIRADSTRVSDLREAYAQVERRFGKIDILFANAGVGSTPVTLAEVTE